MRTKSSCLKLPVADRTANFQCSSKKRPEGRTKSIHTVRTEAPNWPTWLVFIVRSLAEQMRRLEKKVEREKLVLASLPALSLQIVEFARANGRVTIGVVIKLTGASRKTLKAHFRNLVGCGDLGTSKTVGQRYPAPADKVGVKN